MKFNWRYLNWSRNSLAAIYAACEMKGIILDTVDEPQDDVTLYSLNSVNAPEFYDEMKESHCITIAGGPHPSAMIDEVLDYADYVVVGEGEYSLPRLLKNIETYAGLYGFEAAKNMPPEFLPMGVAGKSGYSPNETCVCLNSFPPFTKYKGYMEISRGCPFRCAYCQTPKLFGGAMRHRSIDMLVKASSAYNDLRFLTPNAFSYGSDGRRPCFEKLEKLLTAFDKSKNLYLGTFPSEVRPEFITQQAADLVLQYCSNTKLHFGAQSGSDAVLRRIHRGHTADDTITAVETCKANGLMPVVDYILGLPGETEEEQSETIEQIKWVSRFGKVHAHYFTPLPDTPLWGSEPSRLMPETEKVLGKLALSGRVTGSWYEARARFFSAKRKHVDNDENTDAY